MLRGMAGLNGITLPRMIVSAVPPLAAIADPVTVHAVSRRRPHPELPRNLRLPAARLADRADPAERAPHDQRSRHWSLTASFALAMQALFFAPHVAPFLYFQF